MRNFGKTRTILAMLGLVIGVYPTPAKAAVKTYAYTFNGNLCHKSVFGSSQSYEYSEYGIHNTSTTFGLQVTCPIPLKLDVGTTSTLTEFRIGAYDRHTTHSVSCFVNKQDPSTGAFTIVGSVLTTTTNSGANAPFQSISVALPATSNPVGTAWFLICNLPPVEAGVSHLQNYTVLVAETQ